MITIEPSSSRGMNSLPKKGTALRDTANTTMAIPTVSFGKRRVRFSAGSYQRWNCRMTHVSFSASCRRMLRNAIQLSTGIKISAITSDASNAKRTVVAIGLNIFPSTPLNVRIGTYTRTMIATPKKTGRATSSLALRTTFLLLSSGLRSRSRRRMFSTMTTEPSTIRPKSSAPKLMRFPEMPVRTMPTKAASIERGIASDTMRPPLRLPRRNRRTATTSKPPSTRFFLTVSIVLRTRSVRS